MRTDSGDIAASAVAVLFVPGSQLMLEIYRLFTSDMLAMAGGKDELGGDLSAAAQAAYGDLEFLLRFSVHF
jgi:hypothetical protein